ncbi:hypothetical protein WJX77_012615 [Trebouxia sp. C0004]
MFAALCFTDILLLTSMDAVTQTGTRTQTFDRSLLALGLAKVSLKADLVMEGGNDLESLSASIGSGLEGDKAAQILNKLALREADRRAQLKHQAAASSASAAPSESCKAFLSQIDQWQQSSQAILDTIASMSQQEADVKAELDKLSVSVSEQEQAAAQASYYLPSYDSRQIASTISYLREQIEAAKKMHFGKKKFGFSRKPKKLPASQPATPLAEVHTNYADFKSTQQQHLAEHTAAHNSSGCRSAQQLRGLANLQQQTVVVNAEELAGSEYSLTNLQGCTVHLQGPMSALQIRDLVGCRVSTGPVTGPTFVYGAEDCTLQLASYQIRIHNAHRCALHIRARSNPIIENSDGLQFTSYAPAYAGCDDQLQAAGLHEDSGLWQEVQDFGWLKHSQSPNWCIMPVNSAS